VRFGIAAFVTTVVLSTFGLAYADLFWLLHLLAFLLCWGLVYLACRYPRLTPGRQVGLAFVSALGTYLMGVSLGWWTVVYLVEPMNLPDLAWFGDEGKNGYLEWALFVGTPVGMTGLTVLIGAGVLRQSWLRPDVQAAPDSSSSE
jgi:hypothetical protein